MKILVVEDEQQLCSDIAEDLELERYTVECCYDGLEAWERIFVEFYDLVILDLNLPGMDGLDILRAIRREKPELRVLVLTARNSLEDRVAGLDLGADDYLTKPFDLEELEARVRGLLRRTYTVRSTVVTVAGSHCACRSNREKREETAFCWNVRSLILWKMPSNITARMGRLRLRWHVRVTGCASRSRMKEWGFHRSTGKRYLSHFSVWSNPAPGIWAGQAWDCRWPVPLSSCTKEKFWWRAPGIREANLWWSFR